MKLASFAVALCAVLGFAPAASAQGIDVLVFHGTEGAADPSTNAAIAAIEDLGDDNDFNVTATSDAADINPSNLADYRGVVLLHSAGNVFNSAQETALQDYVQAGGGVLSIGRAAEIETSSSFFNGLIGARPAGSSSDAVTEQVVEVGDRVHPSTRDLPAEWGPRPDRWYQWQSNPTGQVHTVARVRFADWTDDAVRGGSTSRAISWCRDYQGGRSFYTGMGRTAESYAEANFRDHLLGAIQWTTGMVRGNCKATINSNYQATRLTQPNASGQLNQTGEPHGVVVAPNGWVIYIGRSACANNAVQQPNNWSNPNIGLGCGTIHIWDPEQPQSQNNRVTLAGQLDVFGNRGGGDELTKTEHGLLGITLAPDFMESEHIYVYWVPHADVNRTNHTGLYKISRFRLDLDTKTLDEDSEVTILEWRDQVHSCCHVGGGMGFDSEGNLYVTTGDSNSSGGTGGYSGNNPSPEFSGWSYQDARRTAGNTNNLNGKLLRIKPNPDLPDGAEVTPGIGTTYTIPNGPNGPNLFTGDEGNGDQARPEIFAMGLRNPSRLYVDPETDWVYTAWVGPDAGGPNVNQGPEKYESAAVITEAGNYGWPYCMGNKQPYRDRLDNGQLSNRTGPGYIAPGWYDCDNPRNDSVRNTGLTNLPPITPVNVWYGPGSSTNGCGVYPVQANGVPNYSGDVRQNRCPWAGGGSQAIMNGPLYRVPAGADPSVAWPEYWEGKWFLGDESGANNIRHALLMDPDTAPEGGLPTYVDNIKAIVPLGGIGNLMDWKFGEDGALYVLNYSGFFTIGSAASLWRIAYVGGADTPNPDPQYQATGPGEYQFSIGRSGGVSYEWDFGDGSPTSTGENPTHIYEEDGQYDVTLTVTYADNEEVSETVQVNVFANDTTAPTSSHSLSPAQPNGDNGKWRGNVDVTLDAEDNQGGSGVDRIEYRINGGVWQEYDEPFRLSGNGSYTVQYRAIDLAGNQEAPPNEVTVEIDNTTGGGSTCLPQSDEFDGSSLDGKWDVLRPADGGPQLSDGHVDIPLLQGDFIANDSLASNVLLQDAPEGEWTVVTRLNLSDIDAPGEQAGLVIWKSESPNTFSKIVFIENNQGVRQFEHIRTSNGAVNPPIANSITVAPGDLPEDGHVLLRARYDGTAVIAEFSDDEGTSWTRIGQEGHAAQFDAPLRVGLTAFRGSQGSGVVGFDWFRVFAGSSADTEVNCGSGGGGSCLPMSDDFGGSSLDPKWEIFNDNPSQRSVANDHLTLTMAQGDVYTGNFTASNILLQEVPDGPWTATAKIKHTNISVNGRAAGLVIYGQHDPNYFAKAAVQYKNNDLEGNPMNGIWVERTLTTNGAVNGDYGTNWPNSGKLEPPTDYVWVRAVFDGTNVSTFYSLDGSTWEASAPPFPASVLGANGVTKVGLFAKRDGTGDNATVDIDHFRVLPTADPTAGEGCGGGGGSCLPEADEFNGSSLDSKWTVENAVSGGPQVSGGNVHLTMAQGDVYTGNFTASNILLQDTPAGTWTATAKLEYENISANGRAAGLVIYGQHNPNYFAKAAIQYKDNDMSGNPMNGIWMERTLTTDNQVNGNFGGNWPNSGKLEPPTGDIWVRAVFDGTNVSTWYSLDGVSFTESAPSFPASVLGANGVTKIGLFAKHDGGADSTVPVDYFRVTPFADPQQSVDCGDEGGDTIAPVTTASVDPENPNGDGGWYTTPVEVTLSAEDDGEGVETTEYRIDGGDWTEYTEPFSVGGDGVRTVQYRSTDAAGNSESPKSLELRIDASAPETSATLSPDAPDGPNGSYNGPVEITLDPDDGSGSGVTRTEFRVDGGPWTQYLSYQTILDSSPESFARWRQAPSGSFQHRADGSILSQGGLGMLWYEAQEFADFSLKFQFRDERLDSGYSNGGAFVRFPNPAEALALPPAQRHACQVGSAQSSQAWVAIYCGHEIQIYDGPSGEPQKTGSVYNFQSVGLEDAKTTPKGQWNDYEIRVVGQDYTIIRNGEVINEFANTPGKSSTRAGDPPTNSRQFTKGHIGLQNHGSSDVLAYRNVQVMPIVDDGVEGPIVVEGDGQHKVEFRSVDAAGHTEDVQTVSFRIGAGGGPGGKADLSASVKPAKKALGPKAKRVRFRFKVTNQGDAATPGNVKLCVKAQKKRFAVRGAKCVTAKSLGAGTSVAERFTLRIKKAARGKRSRVRFVANGPGIGKRTVVAQVKVKKPRKAKRGGK